MKLRSIIPLATFCQISDGVPANKIRRENTPAVTIAAPSATILGSSSNNVDSFNGIPFAEKPIGSLRLKPPQALTTALGTVTAIGTPRTCPQFSFSTNLNDFPSGILGQLDDLPFFQTIENYGEDCLTLNVVRPAGTTESDKLPVLFWIFGGGFEDGSTQSYDGSSLVASSVNFGKPIIFVAANYRLGGFGFLAGKEVKADGASNIGLLDQRLGLQWVAENIEAFGGDPEKVTIWGESAGSISVLDQMVLYDGDNTYNGKPLFRGAIMDSGTIFPAHPVDGEKGQAIYDAVVSAAGCSSSTNTLECLRSVDYTTFLNAADSVPVIGSYTSVSVSYLPRPDGTILTASPEELIKAGNYTRVPFIVGDQEDEGTLAAIFQPNLTTTDNVIEYMQTVFYPLTDPTVVSDLVKVYPDNVAFGSPYNTGLANNWYPQFKRLAAVLGDTTFTLVRRYLLNEVSDISPEVPSWSYLASYDYGTPVLGTYHGSDLPRLFDDMPSDYATNAIRSYYFSFVHHLDPNVDSGNVDWPQWGTAKEMVNFNASDFGIIVDDFRQEQYEFLEKYETELKL